jgi:hypothetical protein
MDLVGLLAGGIKFTHAWPALVHFFLDHGISQFYTGRHPVHDHGQAAAFADPV